MTEKRAASVTHVEYELLNHIINTVDMQAVERRMVVDEVSSKRFKKGGEKVLQLIQNMMERRQHRLPKDHVDFVDNGR